MLIFLRCLSLIQKRVSGNILFFAVCITFSVLMLQIFTRTSLLKIKTFELSYLYKKVNYINTFTKLNLLVVKLFILYLIIKKFWALFFLI